MNVKPISCAMRFACAAGLAIASHSLPTAAQTASPEQNNPVGFVRAAINDVRLCRYSEAVRRYTCKTAAKGDVLYPNSHLRTGVRSHARIAYADDDDGEPEYISIKEEIPSIMGAGDKTAGPLVRYTRMETGKYATLRIGPETTISLHRQLESLEAEKTWKKEFAEAASKRAWDEATWNPFAGKRSKIWILLRESGLARVSKSLLSTSGPRTGTAICGGRGTDYFYSLDSATGTRTVSVLDGVVACSRDDGPSMEIAAGNEMVVSDDGSAVLRPLNDEDKGALLDPARMAGAEEAGNEAAGVGGQRESRPPAAGAITTETVDRAIIARVDQLLDRAEAAAANLARTLTESSAACAAAVESYWTGQETTMRRRIDEAVARADSTFADADVGGIAELARRLQTRLNDLQSATERIGQRAVTAADNACTLFESANPDDPGAKADLNRVRNLGVLARETVSRGLEGVAAAIDRIEPSATDRSTLIRSMKDRSEEILGQFRENLCKIPVAPLHPLLTAHHIADIRAHGAAEIQREAVSLLKSARASLNPADHERLLLRAGQNGRAIERESERASACVRQFSQDRIDCHNDLIPYLAERTVELNPEATVTEILTRRSAWARDLGALVAAIAAKGAEIAGEVDRAAICLSDAEARLASRPADAGETAASCQAWTAKLDDARTLYRQETGLPAARTVLEALRTEVATASSSGDCPDIAGRVADGLSKIDRLESSRDQAEAALSACQLDQIGLLNGRLSAVRHPAIADVQRQLATVSKVNALRDEAGQAYLEGDLARAESLLRQARSDSGANWPPGCSDLSASIDARLARVQKLGDGLRDARRAVAACDVRSMERWRRRLAEVRNPAALTVKSALDGARTGCRVQASVEGRARADAICRTKLGANAVADADYERGAQTACVCAPGYRFNTEGTSCLKVASAGELLAARQENCRRKFGAGYKPGTPDAKGRYYCLPDQAVADKWCRDKADGRGWSAYALAADGSFKCRQSGKARRRQARADCRVQARRGGKVYAYTEFLKDGRYLCHWCEPGNVYRDKACYPQTAGRRQLTCPSGFVLRGRRCYRAQTGGNRPSRPNRNFCIVNGRNICTGPLRGGTLFD